MVRERKLPDKVSKAALGEIGIKLDPSQPSEQGAAIICSCYSCMSAFLRLAAFRCDLIVVLKVVCVTSFD